tara:strand:+ start:7116 stop:12167 length:5052 start_codon:yes stop_codon:yes gene_type:complete
MNKQQLDNIRSAYEQEDPSLGSLLKGVGFSESELNGLRDYYETGDDEGFGKIIKSRYSPPPQPTPQPTPQPQAVQPQFDEETQKIYDQMSQPELPEASVADSMITEEAPNVGSNLSQYATEPTAQPTPMQAQPMEDNLASTQDASFVQSSDLDRQITQETTEYNQGEGYTGEDKRQVIVDANQTMKNAVKFFADKYMSGTPIEKLLDPNKLFGDSDYTSRARQTLTALSDEIKAIDNNKDKTKEDLKERVMLSKQRKQVAKVVSMLGSKLGADGLLIPSTPGKGNSAIDNAITSGRQEMLAGETTGTKMQAFFPSLTQAIREDEGFASEAVSAISDITRTPGNVVSGMISSGDLWGEKLFQHMGIDPKDKRTRDRVIGEIGNALNYIAPSGTAAAVGSFKGRLATATLGSKLSKSIPRPDMVTRALNKPIPGESSLFDTGVVKGASLFDDKVGAKVVEEGSKGFLKTVGGAAEKAAGYGVGKIYNIGEKFASAGLKTSYQQAPETIVRSLEYLTDKDDRKSELLLELVAQTVLGSAIGLRGKFKEGSMSEASRIQKLYDEGDYNNPIDIEKQLEGIGFTRKQQASQDTMQADDIVELAKLMKDIYSKERYKELSKVMGGTDADVTDLIKTLEAKSEAMLSNNQYTKQYNIAKRELNSLKALVEARGKTTADFKIGEKQINDTGLMEDVVVTSDISSARTAGKAREDATWELDLEKSSFDNLKGISDNINKLTEELKGVSASDFNVTSKQRVGGGSQYTGVDKVAKLQEELNSAKQLLDGIDETVFKKQSSQVVGGARSLPGVDEVNKIKGQLEATQKKLDNIDESNFQGSSQQIVGGKKDFVGVDSANKIQEQLSEAKKLLDGLDESNFKTRSKQMIGGKKEYIGPEKVARLKGELASAKKELKEVSSSDFNKTTKQIIGGGRELPVAERVEALRVQLKELKPGDFKNSKNSYISADGTTQKYVLDFKDARSDLKEEIKLLEAGQFDEANIKFGKSVTKKRTEVDKKSLNQRKDELSNKIKELEGSIESAKKSQFDEANVKYGSQTSRDITKTDGAKFNEFKKELSDRVAKLESELGSAKKSQFDESNIKFGASTSRGITKTDGVKFNEAKKGLSEEIDKLKSELSEAEKIQFEGAKYGQSTTRTSTVIDDVKFNEAKKELSDKVKELESNLELASKGQFDDIKYSAGSSRSRTEVDTGAMAKAKSDIQSKVDKELEGAGAAGLDGGKNAADIMATKAGKIESLEKNIDDLTPDIVEGSEKYYLPMKDYNEKLGQIGDITFEAGSGLTKDSDASKVLVEYVYAPMRANLTKGFPPEKAKVINTMMDELATLHKEIAPLFAKKGGIDKAVDTIEKKLNKFALGGKSDEAIAVLAEFSLAYKANRANQFATATKDMKKGSPVWKKKNKQYKDDLKRMDIFGNAELNQLRSKLQTILDGKKLGKEGVASLKIAKINKAVFTSQGMVTTMGRAFLKLLRASVKGSTQSLTKHPEQTLDAWQSALDKMSAYESGEEIDPITKSINYVDEKVETVKGGVEDLKGAASKAGEVYDIAKPYIKSAKEMAYSAKEMGYVSHARSSGVKYKSTVSFKGAKPIIKNMITDVASAYKLIGVSPLINSVTDPAKDRKGKSHENGIGIDFGTKKFSSDPKKRAAQEKKVTDALKKSNPSYKVDFHDAGSGDHLHIQM